MLDTRPERERKKKLNCSGGCEEKNIKENKNNRLKEELIINEKMKETLVYNLGKTPDVKTITAEILWGMKKMGNEGTA